MADGVVRILRDGALEGEQAPCILVHTTLDTAAGGPIFHYFLRSLHAHISAGRAQARGMVAMALTSPPHSYQGYAEAGDAVSWFQVVDCFTDPLGWEQALESDGAVDPVGSSRYRKMSSRLDGLVAVVVAAGRAAVGRQPGGRFAVLLDSVSDLLRYQRESLPAVAGFVSSLRSHAEVSALVMLVRAGCHDARTVSGLAYLSSVNVYLEPQPSLGEGPLIVLEKNMSGGRIRVRQRRRNGRYREEVEEFQVEVSGLRFSRIMDRNGQSAAASASGISQVKFNLQLTATELEDRAKVVLPFEHQGQGKQVQIYDGRPDPSGLGLTDLSMAEERISASEGAEALVSGGAAEIHYLRDSDDEVPDSDEDPDDDLDI